MLEFSSEPCDEVMSAHQTGYAAGQADHWELVNREAHHRMKNTLMLLAASARRDLKMVEAIELSAAVGQDGTRATIVVSAPI